MKMKRLLASVLALLLVVSILPIGALADDPNTGVLEVNYGTLTSNGTEEGGRGSGTVNNNNGTITNNYGTVNTNREFVCDTYNPTISNNFGYVGENKNIVENNRMNGEVTTNNGTVTNNYGLVRENKNTVVNNKSTGNVSTNNGTVTINAGTVGINNENVNTNSGKVTENNGSITTNGFKGEVTTNNEDVTYNKGTVVTNAANGTVANNYGNIGTNVGTVNTNATAKDGTVKGVIKTNTGIVNTNRKGATVVTNTNLIKENYGIVGSPVEEDDGDIHDYGGNEGTIQLNAGTVTSNAVGAEIEKNTDTLEMNYGTVDENTGTVEYNFEVGEVTNKSGGEVTYNRGTVNNEKDGTLYEYFTEFADGEEPETDKPSKTITEEGTYYGILIDKGTAPEAADAGTWKNGFALVQKKLGEVLDLGSIFKQDGYEVIGYQDASPVEMALDEDAAGPEMVSGTEYNENRPSWLRLIWGKIKAAVKPSASSDDPEPKTVQNNIPTSLSAGQVKVGAYVRRGNLLFRIIEVTDNDIQVATVGKLSDEALADMLGFLKQHLSDAQIAKINGEPKLLEQELVTYFFGDSYEHIAFRAAKDLFE